MVARVTLTPATSNCLLWSLVQTDRRWLKFAERRAQGEVGILGGGRNRNTVPMLAAAGIVGVAGGVAWGERAVSPR